MLQDWVGWHGWHGLWRCEKPHCVDFCGTHVTLELRSVASTPPSPSPHQSQRPTPTCLFVLLQDVIEDVQELVHVELLEDQRRAETDRPVPTATQKNT